MKNMDNMDNMETVLKRMCNNKFREAYQEYRVSEHCRASYHITHNVESYFVNIINNNLSLLENKSFEEIFTLVKCVLLLPVECGGGKLVRYSQGGACGISVLGCYDITMGLIKAIPNSSRPNKIILIKDNTKGPWNYVTQILKLTPKKINDPWTKPYNIYHIEKKYIMESIDDTLHDRIAHSDCDEIETILCKLWQTRNR